MEKQFEKVRRKLRIYNIIEILIILLVIFLIYYVCKIDMDDGLSLIAISPIMFLIILLVFFLIKIDNKKKYKLLYKQYYVLTTLKRYFDDVDYAPEYGLSESAIYSTNAMKLGNNYFYSSNDLILGRYKNVRFMQADVHIEKKYHVRVHSSIGVTVFKGRWLIFDFNKEFKSNFIIIKKGFQDSKENGLFNKNYRQLHTESKSFNKKFYIDATNEYDAFYILTPSLMEKIERLDSKVDGDIILVFSNGKLHVGIDNRRDAFEPPSVFTKINENDVLNSVFNDIKVITDIVDELSLDNSLVSKIK